MGDTEGDERANELLKLHLEIDNCRICETGLVTDLQKPLGLDRGEPGRVMIVGQSPGSAELARRRAFAGPAGKRLTDWLIASGADPSSPRAGIYLTSLLKCVCPTPSKLPPMLANCRRFLVQQLRLIRPELVISLGADAYAELSFSGKDYSMALCRAENSRDYFLAEAPPHGFHFTLLPWPHPSGRNRYLNEAEVKTRLAESFAVVRAVLRQDNA